MIFKRKLKIITNAKCLKIMKKYLPLKHINFIIENKVNYFNYLLEQRNIIIIVNDECVKECLKNIHREKCFYNSNYGAWNVNEWKKRLDNLNKTINYLYLFFKFIKVDEKEIFKQIHKFIKKAERLTNDNLDYSRLINFDYFIYNMQDYKKSELINFYEKIYKIVDKLELELELKEKK